MAGDEWFRGEMSRCPSGPSTFGFLRTWILIPKHDNTDVVADICKEVFSGLEPIPVAAGEA